MEEKKVVTIDDFKKEAFKRKLKGFYETAKVKVKQGVKWASDHTGETAALITGAGLITKNVVKSHSLHEEQRRRDTQFFEHRSGKWCETKRKLTPREQLEAETRHQNGETWTQIFSDMKLLR